MIERSILISSVAAMVFAYPAFSDAVKNLSPVFERGCSQMMHKNFGAAISSFTEAISGDANNFNSYFRRGQCFFCQSNYKEAILDFDRAIAAGGSDANVFLWRGTAHARANNDELAVRDFEKAMRLNPKLVENYKSASETVVTASSGKEAAKISLGTNQRSIDDYATAIKNVTAYQSGYFRSGTAYSGICNFSGELIPVTGLKDQSESVISQHSGHPYFSLKNPGRDMRDLSGRIIAHPDDANLYFLRARAYGQLGDHDKALADLVRAIDLDKTNPHYLLARAYYYFQQHKLDLAENDIRQAQDIDPIVPVDLTFEPPSDVPAAKS